MKETTLGHNEKGERMQDFIYAVFGVVEAVNDNRDDEEFVQSLLEGLMEDVIQPELLVLAFIEAAPGNEERYRCLRVAAERMEGTE